FSAPLAQGPYHRQARNLRQVFGFAHRSETTYQRLDQVLVLPHDLLFAERDVLIVAMARSNCCTAHNFLHSLRSLIPTVLAHTYINRDAGASSQVRCGHGAYPAHHAASNHGVRRPSASKHGFAFFDHRRINSGLIFTTGIGTSGRNSFAPSHMSRASSY